jgi:hypothetical protein
MRALGTAHKARIARPIWMNVLERHMEVTGRQGEKHQIRH